MKVEELRIGNLVEYPGWNRDGTKAYFKARDIYTDYNKISLTNGVIQLPSSNLEYLKPIPLTEEILLDCGFEKIITDCEEFGESVDYVLKYRDKTSDMFILSYCDDFSINISGDERDFGVCPDLEVAKHVHQLQNLFYALTGQELEFKTLGK